jgi:nucleoside 2-deoxyribosyltransferase
MNCFAIMPFAEEFDDVYTTIKSAVEGAVSDNPVRCFRLDENRAAGRISERLLKELQSASFCIADLTGCRPNVMWEIGYAMALRKPTIIVTQSLNELPFDIRDMQSLQYDRHRLKSTLAVPLRMMVIDTLAVHAEEMAQAGRDNDAFARLTEDVATLKSMLVQAVQTWAPDAVTSVRPDVSMLADVQGLQRLEGAWRSVQTGSHYYATPIDGDLIVAYCYAGNEHLTGIFYGWQRAGNYWFGRFKWINGAESGFAFLTEEPDGSVQGRWWRNSDNPSPLTPAKERNGIPMTWKRASSTERPRWASEFLDEVGQHGLHATLVHHRSRREN